MNTHYFFPSPLTQIRFAPQKEKGIQSVCNGYSAARILLRNLNLKKNSKVAIPRFVCDRLKNSVLHEGLSPLWLDLKGDNTVWSDYNEKLLSSNMPSAVILIHLYGLLHPDSQSIMQFCKTKNIPVLHDLAQGDFSQEQELSYSAGSFISFGPGKSNTAAGGAIVRGLSEAFYKAQVMPAHPHSLQNYKARCFLKSRIFQYPYSPFEKAAARILARFSEKSNITCMTPFQVDAACEVQRQSQIIREGRELRYAIFMEGIKKGNRFGLPLEISNGNFFKLVLREPGDPESLKKYLNHHAIPFYQLFADLQVEKEHHTDYPNFMSNASRFFEFSCEASLPTDEIGRVANLLCRYQP